jgi:hypothetical protein
MVLHRPNDPLLLGVPGVIPVHTATAVAVRIDVRLREPGRT